MSNIAISIIAYNRLSSMKRLLCSLEQADYGEDEVTLVISIDKSDTDIVERYADTYQWKYGIKKVMKHETNMGLRKHVLSQGRLLEQYDAVIVLEDDLTVAPDFWNYTKQTVEKYKDCDDIAGISLYSFSINYHTRHPFIPLRDGNDVFFMNCAMSWGQVWMRKQWQAFEQWYSCHQDFSYMDHLPDSICSWGEKSWLRYHTRYCIEENKYFVFPHVSYSTNFSEVGTHVDSADCIFQVPLQNGKIDRLRLPDFGSTGVYYDGFFENKGLYGFLGLTEDECCLDLSGSNHNRIKKRYWLTTKVLPYKISKSYNFFCRPIEQNVFIGNAGEGIYLYDTSCNVKNKCSDRRRTLLASHYIPNAFLFVREYGYLNVVRDFIRVVKDKLKIR